MEYEVPFIRASTAARELLVSSRIHTIAGHWDTLNGGFRLCSQETCAYCRDGARIEKRALMRLECERQGSYLLEARERLFPVVRKIQELHLSGRSAWVNLWKEGSARNSPVRLDILRVVAYSELYDIQALFRRMYKASVECDPVEVEVLRTEEEELDLRRASILAQRPLG